MKSLTVVVSTAILGLSTLVLLSSAALADSTKMAQLAGRYTVNSCKYNQNYKNRPKDYYCRAKEFTLIDKKDGSVELRFVDELNQDRLDVVMAEYKKDQKDGTIEQATFDTGSEQPSWVWTIEGGRESSTERRSFKTDAYGNLVFTRYISFYNNTTNVYKVAQWDFAVVKEK